MQAAPARYVSVSELYSTDEVELLLDEIRDLEPTSCRGEDVQDFEIAGSGFGGCGGAGGRSPAGTELTERSWDSHAHYSRAPPPPPRPLAPLYCRLRHLRTLPGALTLLLVLCSGGACGCVWAVSGVRVSRLPLASRAQLLLLAALSSLLLHAALLLMHVSRLTALLPLNWEKFGMWASAWSGASLAGGGLLTLHAVLLEPAYRWTPPLQAALLCSAAGLGLAGACAAIAMVSAAARACYGVHLRAAGLGGLGGVGGSGGGSAGSSARALYRAVPSAPQPSTSRHEPL